ATRAAGIFFTSSPGWMCSVMVVMVFSFVFSLPSPQRGRGKSLEHISTFHQAIAGGGALFVHLFTLSPSGGEGQGEGAASTSRKILASTPGMSRSTSLLSNRSTRYPQPRRSASRFLSRLLRSL